MMGFLLEIEMKDFDITQINKDTKVVVFRVAFAAYMGSEGSIDYIDGVCRDIGEKLKDQGITALFVDDLIQIEPLTDDLLSTGDLKSI